ncbi:MAG: hypothetical protein A3H59_00990 [Candidatus Jacksonbacteria bacterium RIFCSPLOWO2_02_FULL_43_9]|nr:MAG: Two component transcriptional regulator, winged helix family protein [Parcubacteria group bacterium GW2011_GWA2_43_13]OGY68977.1 MAG: hypothetical protein A3B94_02240 [Candidatus Jacksonbacteria bacterium RIFCSPHIGHO2_02_FULL_43_10]OGY70364.1 MAG: hypothetical protein A2986_00205 [Candidatus Jacksonbacteria bacterium RIFCSPLOWO2_01_FULL_44_13]OGY73797.1 MAG: hypothetical protein A3H59_00990 [Candidatus Jacksonbacteria bacterium RIFCSPLOWO2_02_FULL_43_9]HAZ16556.1 hypothetical protein [C
MSKTHKHILIVEDDQPLAHVLSLKIEAAGLIPLICEDGGEVIGFLEKYPIGLVVLDIILPTKNGFEVLEELRNRSKVPPIVVWSNLEQEEDRDRARKLGIKDYFYKTKVSLTELLDYIVGHVSK